ncbi:MAG: 8-amino-7-oxononanoate synthase [Ignavibacteria bacterium]|nr:8-amino-7-oxononanoate synthase [Ignavibacteria bacterium]
MNHVEEKLRQSLDQRISEQSFRVLTIKNGLIDFCSNDYLGFSRSALFRERISELDDAHPSNTTGSTGSRLLSGNSSFFEELEHRIAQFHQAEDGLIFNSGYDANLGVFSCVPKRTDTLLYDQLVHASIRDGIRLSNARAYPFKHNDIEDLEKRITISTGNIFVAVESVYSMDGDCAPLTDIATLCKQFGAHLIVDEAHATGVFGVKGEGRVVELGLQNEIFARIHTFGKALGSHGAIVLGSEVLRSYLINFCRSFIYTTALPFHSLLAIQCAYNVLASDTEMLPQLRSRISYFKSNVGTDIRERVIESASAIQCLVVSGNENVRSLAHHVQEAGFDVRPILHPTVPRGKERLRICLHAFNTEAEIEDLLRIISSQLS